MVGLVIVVALCLYTVLAVFVARRAGRLAKSRTGRNVVVAALLVLFYVAPVSDGIYGYFVLQRLCATEAKTEVLKPIKIPPEYFNPDGSPRFLAKRFEGVDWDVVSKFLDIRVQRTKDYHIAGIDREISTLSNHQDGELLARQTGFFFRGSWLRLNEWKVWSDRCTPGPSFGEIVLRSTTRK